MNDNLLQVESTPIGTNTAVILTIRYDNLLIASEKIDIANSRKRDEFITQCCQKSTHIDREELEKRLLVEVEKTRIFRANVNNNSKPDCGDDKHKEPLGLSQQKLEEMDPKLIEYAKTFLQRQDLIPQIIQHVQDLNVAGERNLILTLYLIGTSRLLQKPLAGIVMGASSAGKSFLIDTVSECG